MSRLTLNRFAIPLAVFALLVVMFAVALKRAPDKMFVPSALIGKPAPQFVLPNLLEPGATVDSLSLKGRWYLLNVWGTWCPECRAEHQTLLDIKQEGKAVVVGLNYKDDDAKARQWLTDLGNPYEVIAVDQEGRAAIDYGVYGAPESFLVNPQGLIVHKVVGVVTPESWRGTMLPLIEGKAP
jgi:cytochrome c biogenesis protein CcmG, thiol:disulfide interchange protein DsbE